MARPDWQAALLLEWRGRFAESAAAYGKLAGSEPDPRSAALAAQGQIRCLALSGARGAALAAIRQRFGGRPAPLTDLNGRLIAADEQLLALHLMKPGDTQYAATVRRLAGWLNDYGVPMPSAQRLFLMDEMRALAGDSVAFPAYRPSGWPRSRSNRSRCAQAIRRSKAAPFAISGDSHRPTAGPSPYTAPIPWRLPWTASWQSKTARGAPGSPCHRQAQANTGESIAVGVMLPGWQVSFSLLNTQPFEEAARRRMTAYLWAGYLAVAAIVLAGFLVGQTLRRQARLARLKTDLVATVSHELKTPLASMRLLLETLLEDGFQDEQTAREYLEMIAGENLRLSRLIENFLTFSRMERNRQKFDFAETTAEEVIQPALLAVGERRRAPDSHIEVEVAADLPPLWADRDALVTVLLNLLDNAYKYTREEKRISVCVSRENGHVVFAVKDNGIGIAPREQKRIFRRFYQVDRRLARQTGGCGLGLSIVDFIVRAHGGRVNVESHPGTGSTFRVSLPYEADSRGPGA